jgi:hypothetical protein
VRRIARILRRKLSTEPRRIPTRSPAFNTRSAVRMRSCPMRPDRAERLMPWRSFDRDRIANPSADARALSDPPSESTAVRGLMVETEHIARRSARAYSPFGVDSQSEKVRGASTPAVGMNLQHCVSPNGRESELCLPVG